MNWHKFSRILIATGVVTTLIAFLLFSIEHFQEQMKFGWYKLIISTLIMIAFLVVFLLPPFALMTKAVHLAQGSRYGSLLISFVLFLAVSLTEVYFLGLLFNSEYNRPSDPNWRMTPGEGFLFISCILHWFTTCVTLIIALISRSIENRDHSESEV